MRLNLTVEWESTSALCIGSTADAQGLGVDKATARDSQGQLIIPASTLKGRLRHECERIARAFGEWVCDSPRARQMCPGTHPQGGYCIVCEIFGSPGLRSPLDFSNAVLKTALPVKANDSVNQHRRFDAQVRPGVSLSRARRAAFSERLFFVETTAPNTGFRFEARIEGEVPGAKHRALLLAGLRNLSLVGGGKSRGLGWGHVVRWVLDGQELPEARLVSLLKEGGYA